MKTIAIIQARMGSTRLPGKVLKKVLGKTLLEYQLERVQRSSFIDKIVVATTVKESDDVLVALCNRLNIPVYRGSEVDVLARYYEAAVESKADVVVRLTSDCPLIDSAVVDGVIQLYLDSPDVDYASNALKRTFPRGLDTEVFSFDALEESFHHARKQSEREHVTPFIHQQPHKFKMVNFSYHTDVSHHRWTVDTKEDFELIRRIIEALYSENHTFTMQDVLDLLEQHSSWVKLNAHIEQKKL